MRTPITLKIKFKSANLGQFIERYSVDVSRGGIFIRTKEPLPVGTQLKFEFQLQDTSALIAGDGTVVWIREPDPNRAGVAPGMGVRFDKLAPTSLPVLDQILAEKAKRGEAAVESRFDAGVRANATASGTMGGLGPARPPGAPPQDFSGGDSKAHTPLPKPMPGLDAPGDEFGEESTRVMQNEMVEQLAKQTREEAAAAFAADEPTRRASADELADLTKQGAPAAPASSSAAAKPETNGVAAAASAPEPEAAPKPSPAVSSAAASGGAGAGPSSLGSLTLPADERRGSARPEKRGGAPILPIVLLLGAGAAGGGYWFFTRDDGATKTPPVTTTTTPTPPSTPTPPPEANPTTPTPTATTPAPTPPATATTPTPAAPKGLSIPITSDPPGATVTVDGAALPSPTPTELKDADDKKLYEVKLSLKGFHDYKVAKYKPKANDKIDAALVPNEKHVEVSSTPAGADVFFDGKKVGKTPFTIKKLDVSKQHALEVKRVGFVTQSRTISSTDSFESKGDKDVLALALTLEAEPKKTAAPKAATPTSKTPTTTAKPVVGGDTTAKPATPTEKPPVEEKKPEATEKPPVEEKKVEPAEKEKPAEPAPAKKKPAEEAGGGGGSTETPSPAPAN